ncbi:MAG TPA: haloacid dehalogenase type II [Thermoleophilaceae bacterium]|jgi:2-haloacid dehalogenase|nr:haloacid dehalogenase type II [Thermoleophilaceae bacterium]
MVRVATFDCYGTLIDWEGGAAGFLYEQARRHEREPPPARELRERWEELQFQRLRDDWRSYREVLTDSLSEWAGERGYRWNERDGEALARAMESWQPFPDTVPALRAAKEAGLRLWIISNTDRAIIEHTLRHLEVDFDGLTVAEDCRAYKPSPEPFERALREIDARPEEIVHVAFGFKYDIATAKQFGLRTAWVNRRREPAPGPERPDHEWRDLWPLPEVTKLS